MDCFAQKERSELAGNLAKMQKLDINVSEEPNFVHSPFQGLSTNVSSYPGASLSDVLKYLFSPNREYTPSTEEINMYDIETVEANKFQTAHYTPSCWFDSVVPVGFSNGTTNHWLDSMYLKYVEPNVHLVVEGYARLEDSSLWHIISSLNEENAEGTCQGDGLTCATWSQQRNSSIIRNRLYFLKDTACFYDEAPLFRILLLIDCLQSAESHDRYDYVAQNLFFQSYGFTTSISWPYEITDNNKGHNAPGLHSSFIRCVTLSYYEKLLSGEVSLPVHKYVMVPVAQSYSTSRMLFPYIASFTTTAWWNFGLVVNTRILDSTTGQPYGNYSIKSFPEACTVYVPGEFENILLVLFDQTAEYCDIKNFFVGELEIPLTNENSDNPVNFSLPFYKYLGRHGAPSYPFNVSMGNINDDVLKAMNYLKETVCMPGVFQRCLSMLAETCRMRYHNNWVIPGRKPLSSSEPAPPSDQQKRYKYFTPMMNLTGKQQTIGDRDLAAISDFSVEHLENLKIAAMLRASPMHVIPSSYVHIHRDTGENNDTDTVPMPCFGQLIGSVLRQYRIKEAKEEARIFIALHQNSRKRQTNLRVFEISPYAFISESSLSLEVTQFASVCGAVAEWAISYFGINFFDMNQLVEISYGSTSIYHHPQMLIEFWPSLTHNFISPPMVGTNPLIPAFSDMLRQKMANESLKVDHLHGGLLPWWYVCAVALKLFSNTIAIPKLNPQQIFDQNRTILDMGFFVKLNDPWYSFPFYSSNNQYDHPMFQNYLICHQYFNAEPVAWFPDAYIDATRFVQSLRSNIPAPQQPKYLCEILTTPVETARWSLNEMFFVSYSCPAFTVKDNFIPVLKSPFLNLIFDNQLIWQREKKIEILEVI